MILLDHVPDPPCYQGSLLDSLRGSPGLVNKSAPKTGWRGRSKSLSVVQLNSGDTEVCFGLPAAPADAFVDADPGDVLHLHARLADGRPLPPWLRFDPKSRRFQGRPPAAFTEELTIAVVASDVDGLEVASSFRLRASAPSGG